MTAHDPAVSSAGPAPATDRDTLRERIVEALLTTRRADYADLGVRANHRVHRFDARCALCTYDVDALADAVLAVLPAPDQQAADVERWQRKYNAEHARHVAVVGALVTDRAAVLLWAADQIDAETRQAKADGVLEPDKFRPCRDASAQLRRLAGEAQQDRCPSCDHKSEFHDADGRCWFTVDHGTPGSNLVCPCAPRRDASEAQQDPAQDGRPEAYAIATRFAVNLLPETDINAHSYEITVDYRGNGLWAVVRHHQCMNAQGEWSWESIPSEREDEWVAEHRFDLDTALRLAKEAAPGVTVNGCTAAEALKRAAARQSR
jgi:hypothetical protein